MRMLAFLDPQGPQRQGDGILVSLISEYGSFFWTVRGFCTWIGVLRWDLGLGLGFRSVGWYLITRYQAFGKSGVTFWMSALLLWEDL